MKRLTLVRHAKSSWKDPERADFDRPLNKRGKQDAPRMGERLAARGERPDLILTSPARRARKTAKEIARKIGLPGEHLVLEAKIYEAETEALLEVVRNLDDRWEGVLLVGHNPGLTDLVNLLGNCGIENLATCGVLRIDFDVETWRSIGPGSGAVVFYDYPKRPSS